MRSGTLLTIGLLVGCAGGSATASPCSTEIETVSKQVKEGGRKAISASSGGQAVAGAREGSGVTGAPPSDASQASAGKSADAGQDGETVQAANVALDEARTLDGKGDEKGCLAAIEKAKEKLAQTK